MPDVTSSERTPAEALLALRALLSDRAFKKSFKIGFGFKEGERGVLAVNEGGARLEAWSRETDVSVLTNVATMWDLLLGRFDPRAPSDRHLFLWAGDQEVLAEVARALGAAKSLLDLRAGMSSDSAPKRKRKQRGKR